MTDAFLLGLWWTLFLFSTALLLLTLFAKGSRTPWLLLRQFTKACRMVSRYPALIVFGCRTEGPIRHAQHLQTSFTLRFLSTYLPPITEDEAKKWRRTSIPNQPKSEDAGPRFVQQVTRIGLPSHEMQIALGFNRLPLRPARYEIEHLHQTLSQIYAQEYKLFRKDRTLHGDLMDDRSSAITFAIHLLKKQRSSL